MKRRFQIDFLRGRGLQPEHFLLDIGCGTLRGGIPVIDYLDAGRYFGFEVRADVLEEGRRELREAGLEHKAPALICAPTIADGPTERRFDFIWAFSVLIHMDDDVLQETLELVARQLAEGGSMYANVNVGIEEEEGSWQGFPVVRRPLAFYRDMCARIGLAVTDLGALSSLGHVSGDEAQDAQHMLHITRGGDAPA